MIGAKLSLVVTTALAAVGVIGLATVAQGEPLIFNKVNFTCEMEGNQYVTKVQEVQVSFDPTKVPAYTEQAVESPSNVIVWTATLASDNPKGIYTPQNRCQAVSAHLTNLASALGISSSAELAPRLADITKVSRVNGQKVVFPAYQNQTASNNNVIFTLKPYNARKAADTLAQFQIGISPGVGGPDLPVNVRPPVVE